MSRRCIILVLVTNMSVGVMSIPHDYHVVRGPGPLSLHWFCLKGPESLVDPLSSFTFTSLVPCTSLWVGFAVNMTENFLLNHNSLPPPHLTSPTLCRKIRLAYKLPNYPFGP